MRRRVIVPVLGVTGVVAAALVALAILSRPAGPSVEELLAACRAEVSPVGLAIDYPADGTVFPPEIVAATFRWQDGNPDSDMWLVRIGFEDGTEQGFLTGERSWTAGPEQWEAIKRASLEKECVVTIAGFKRSRPAEILSAGSISLRTSQDKVGAPLFYREVNLPFVEAVKDPSHIRWRFGSISSPQSPPVVLEKLPVCGNCHSFSSDGSILGMDVDYASDKGSYAIAAVRERFALTKSNIITWSDYRRDDGEPTFGLLSQVSPDGRYVVSTVKDESVFVPKPGLEFSQLFFPVKGILCIYDRQSKTYSRLPGADDPNLVQSNPTWSPDGRYIVFARTQAYRLRRGANLRKVLLSAEECSVFLKDGRPFKFDLYRIEFNEGKGGVAEPLEGASNNGMSNFFARYSPDGQWIVFCKAANYMLLQPDSELYIMPAEGGEPRRLECNTNRMNSWHSWSPNGRWLVFSSKVNSAYTQLMLTHIDENGRSSPPVVLSQLTAPDRAANIPEFVNASASAIREIREQFVDEFSFLRAAKEFAKAGDFQNAERQCRKALELNPNNAEACCNLGLALHQQGRFDEARKHLSEAVRLDPNNADAHYNMGHMMLRMGEFVEAIRHWSEVVRLDPNHVKSHANLGAVYLNRGVSEKAAHHLSEALKLDPNNTDAHYNLGRMMLESGRFDEAITHMSVVARLEPNDVEARYTLGLAFVRAGQVEKAVEQWLEVLRIAPDNLGGLMNLADVYSETGQFDKAILCGERALELARSKGDQRLARKIRQSLDSYRRRDKDR